MREALEENRTARGIKLSVADALADLRGTISGPRDLSTNPKHLEGFGR